MKTRNLSILCAIAALALVASAPASAQVVIHEIMQNPSAVSDAAGEWFELHNPTASPIDVDGWTIADNDSDSHTISNGGPLLIPAGGYLVLGVNADPATNGGVAVDYELSSFILANGADEVVLFDGSLEEIDRVEYDGGPVFPDPNGASMALIDPALDNNVGGNWCEASTPFGDGDLGTPGAANDCVVETAQVVIHEIMQNPSAVSDGSGEWFELYNPSAAPIDVDGWTIADNDFDSHLISNGGPLTIPAGGYLVLGNNGDPATNGGVAVDYVYSGVFLANGADEVVLLDAVLNEVDRVEYDGGPVFPDPNGASMSLVDPALDNNAGTNWCEASTPFGDGDLGTPGAANDCGAEPFEIWEIQGSGLASPLVGMQVSTLDNVVTALDTNGFFMQTPAARVDGDPLTSDGIFVFTGSAPAVAVGDRVDVVGTVQEFFDLTELTSPEVTVVGSGAPLPAAVTLDENLPDPNLPPQSSQLEPLEGMLVAFDGIASGPSDRFGDVAVVAGSNPRGFREPGIELPGLSGLPVWDGNPEVFEIDPDGLGGADTPIFATQALAAEGPLTFSFGDYQLLPTALVLGPEPALPRPVRDRNPGELTVASQNMFRVFDDVDDPGINEPVLTTAEFDAVLGKFSAHFRDNLGAPDVIAVQEVENLNVLDSLAARIAADDPALSYSAHLIEGNDVGGIDVGYLTRDDTIQVLSVDQFGESLILSFDGSLLNDRPPLVLDALYVGGGASFPLTVVNVHQRSLGGIDDPADGLRVKTKRLEQAEALAGFIQSLQTADPDLHLVVTGDFNAFQFTDGYVDVMGIVTGDLDPLGAEIPGTDLVDPNLANQVLSLPAEERYSFVFGGNAQVLDHALTSSALDGLVTDFAYARGNADSPNALLDDGTTTLRASDHDALVLYLFADSDRDGVADGADLCADTSIPEEVPTVRLGNFRYALVDGDTTFDTRVPQWFPHDPPTYTTEDTGGCSCEQILDHLGLPGLGHRKFGCGPVLMELWVYLVEHHG